VNVSDSDEKKCVVCGERAYAVVMPRLQVFRRTGQFAGVTPAVAYCPKHLPRDGKPPPPEPEQAKK
jgi:hypothetical protein